MENDLSVMCLCNEQPGGVGVAVGGIRGEIWEMQESGKPKHRQANQGFWVGEISQGERPAREDTGQHWDGTDTDVLDSPCYRGQGVHEACCPGRQSEFCSCLPLPELVSTRGRQRGPEARWLELDRCEPRLGGGGMASGCNVEPRIPSSLEGG